MSSKVNRNILYTIYTYTYSLVRAVNAIKSDKIIRPKNCTAESLYKYKLCASAVEWERMCGMRYWALDNIPKYIYLYSCIVIYIFDISPSAINPAEFGFTAWRIASTACLLDFSTEVACGDDFFSITNVISVVAINFFFSTKIIRGVDNRRSLWFWSILQIEELPHHHWRKLRICHLSVQPTSYRDIYSYRRLCGSHKREHFSFDS